jgi:hypothetical protein
MPDEYGNLRPISVPALPWLQWFEAGDRVRTIHEGWHGTVIRHDETGVWVLTDEGDNPLQFKPGELRPLDQPEKTAPAG